MTLSPLLQHPDESVPADAGYRCRSSQGKNCVERLGLGRRAGRGGYVPSMGGVRQVRGHPITRPDQRHAYQYSQYKCQCDDSHIGQCVIQSIDFGQK